MVENDDLQSRARQMSYRLKKQIVELYIKSLYEIAVYDEASEGALVISPDGRMMAEHLLEQETWKKYRIEVEESIKKDETYH